MYSTKKNVLQLLSLLKAFNISKLVASPGSRHIPIVISMEQDSFFKLYSDHCRLLGNPSCRS